MRGLGGKFPDAIAALKEALAITPPDPEDARTYSGLGEMYALQGENKLARATFQQKRLRLHLDLGLGRAEAVVWTCDLSPEYVRINADYTS